MANRHFAVAIVIAARVCVFLTTTLSRANAAAAAVGVTDALRSVYAAGRGITAVRCTYVVVITFVRRNALQALPGLSVAVILIDAGIWTVDTLA